MASDHPFQQLFETFGKLPETHAENVNLKARERMKDQLSVGLEKPGQCILLKAPRAGHGKTHLLTRLQHELGGTHEFVPLHAIGGSRIDASTVLDDTLRRLVRPLPAAGGLTVLDLVARRLFSSSLQPLVRSGEVPCQDREGALNALRNRPIETFDFHHPSAVTAHWARENFELLGPRLAMELSQRNGLSLREVSFWVNAMFRFTATPIDNPGRVRALAATVFDDPSAAADAHERLVAVLGLMTSLMRVVLVADELEGFSSDETEALRFASFIGALRQSVDRLDVIISINQDVWESAFLPRLSGGLADRLSEVVVELEPLDRSAKISILDSRSPNLGARILAEMDSESIPTYARGLIQKAAECWGKALVSNGQPETEFAASETPSPSEEVRQIKEDLARSETALVETENQEKPTFTEDAPVGPQDLPEEASSVPEPFEQSGRIEIDTAMQDHAHSFEPAPEADPAPESDPIPQDVLSSPAESIADAPKTEPLPHSLSWPAPEVSESKVDEIPDATASSELPQEVPVAEASQGPPADLPAQGISDESGNFSPPEPEKSSVSFVDPSSGFEVVPPQQPKPGEIESDGDASEKSVDRVDDLLKQFRERYGKS